MQQQPTSNSAPPLQFSPNTITTDQIQKYLEENKNLIMAILENQNLGKLAECAQYQAILQRNLMYLAAIADAQPPQTSSTPSQLPPSSGPQQGNNMQQMQTTAFQQQQGVSGPKLPFQLNTVRPQDQQAQVLQFQAQQQFQGQAAANNGMHQMLHPGLSSSRSFMEGRVNKQNSLEANSCEGQGK